MSVRTRRFVSLLRSRGQAAILASYVDRHLGSWDVEEAKRILPLPDPLNTVLRSEAEVAEALDRLRRLRLPEFYDDPHKVWDGARFLSFALHRLSADSAIVDLGSGPHSNVLYWLDLLGFRNLTAVDLVFRRPTDRGHVHYVGGNMAQTGFPDRAFDCIVAQSSIEHGVSLSAFFAEAARLCKPGGHLLLSTDYWPEKIRTDDVSLYGVPWRIFSAEELHELFAEANAHGFERLGPLNPEVGERIIGNKSRRYTFIFLAFQRSVDPRPNAASNPLRT